jgi:hypothetical protein
MGKCIDPCILILALYLLDLCWFLFSLVQCMYVWSVVNRTYGVLPSKLMRIRPAPASKTWSRVYMQSVCTSERACCSLLARLALICMFARVYIMNVYSTFFTQQSIGILFYSLNPFKKAGYGTHGWVYWSMHAYFSTLFAWLVLISVLTYTVHVCMKCCQTYPWRAPLHVGE